MKTKSKMKYFESYDSLLDKKGMAVKHFDKIKKKMGDQIRIVDGVVMFGSNFVTVDEYGNVFANKENSPLSKMLCRIILESETESFTEAKTAEEIYHYVIDLHGDEDEDSDLGDRIFRYEYYILTEVDIAKIDSPYNIDDHRVEEYVGMYNIEKTYPPIVVDKDLTVIDGGHRYETLLHVGAKTIKVYKPCGYRTYLSVKQKGS
jgi:hypothetical protein